jgi:hypothetical protein
MSLAKRTPHQNASNQPAFVVLAIMVAEADLQPAELDVVLSTLPVRQQRQWLRLMQGALRAMGAKSSG